MCLRVSVLSIFLSISLYGWGNELSGFVIKVNDGDTLTVIDQNNFKYKIRLSGIDAPENHQPFGAQSRKGLLDMVYNQRVKVLFDKHDRYGRIIGHVYLGTLDVNYQQIKNGMAWVYTKYINELSPQMQVDYAVAEKLARIQKTGLWVNADQMAPWEFRKQNKSNLY